MLSQVLFSENILGQFPPCDNQSLPIGDFERGSVKNKAVTWLLDFLSHLSFLFTDQFNPNLENNPNPVQEQGEARKNRPLMVRPDKLSRKGLQLRGLANISAILQICQYILKIAQEAEPYGLPLRFSRNSCARAFAFIKESWFICTAAASLSSNASASPPTAAISAHLYASTKSCGTLSPS